MQLDRLRKLAGLAHPLNEEEYCVPWHPNLHPSGTGKAAMDPMKATPHSPAAKPEVGNLHRSGTGKSQMDPMKAKPHAGASIPVAQNLKKSGTGKEQSVVQSARSMKEDLVELVSLLEADEGDFPQKVKEVLSKVRDLHRAAGTAKKNGDMGMHRRIEKGMNDVHSKICTYWDTHCK